MALSIGIVGLPNVGKSTLFNALTKAQNAQAANYPFCTIEPNKATVTVPDKRLEKLVSLVSPQKTINATVDFIDIAGLVKGASKGEGLGNQFLANIRETSTILEVVRCFDDENIVHVDGKVDPVRDVETIETELILADIQTVTKRMEKLIRLRNDKEAQKAAEQCKALLEVLDSGKLACQYDLPDSDYFMNEWREMSLLTAKPFIYCANVDEEGLSSDSVYYKALETLAKERKCEIVKICARVEEELQGLDEADQLEMLQSYGVEESGLLSVIHTGYKTLGLASYFTAGEKEVRAWTFEKGYKAPQCAGVIHSDFERGFIRAEVISYEDYIKHGSESACRTSGTLRTEGKEYIVQDGDVMHFLFNV